ncbi:hypothetical protein PHYSODRAFT_508682, partial [Phytophthora sojae]
CTNKAIDGAASNGHLDVVKWFGGTDVAYNSSHAIDGAATGGHLHVGQWLNDNYPEIACTSSAMVEYDELSDLTYLLYAY